jgi:hypothetical protein
MSKQGELLIDEYLGEEDTTLHFSEPEDQNKILDLVNKTMKGA